MLTADELRIVHELRAEANDVKDCFTKYSLQGLTFASVILGATIKFQADGQPHVGYAGILVVLLLLTLARMGTHKYATANRHFGYQLHLERLASLPAKLQSDLDERIRKMNWEEAMRAWRIVQATLYESLYTPHERWRPSRPHKHVMEGDGFRWFLPEEIQAEDGQRAAIYHPGSYLKTMLEVLYLAVAFALSILLSNAVITTTTLGWMSGYSIMSITIFVLVVLFSVQMYRILEARRRALEGGILSIHSCALIWHAVGTAHFRALDEVASAGMSERQLGLKGYRAKLGKQAVDLSREPLELHEWIYGARAKR